MTSWDGTVILTTSRLLLRTYRREDLPLFAALNADLAVMENLGGEALTRERSDEIAEWAQQCFASEGVGLLAVRTTPFSACADCTTSAPTLTTSR